VLEREPDAAARILETLPAQLDELFSGSSASAKFRHAVSNAFLNLGNAWADHHPKRAKELYEKAIAYGERYALKPLHVDLAVTLGGAHVNLARLSIDEAPTLAIPSFDRGIELLEVVLAEYEDHPVAAEYIAIGYMQRGMAYRNLQQFAKALESYERSWDRTTSLVQRLVLMVLIREAKEELNKPGSENPRESTPTHGAPHSD